MRPGTRTPNAVACAAWLRHVVARWQRTACDAAPRATTSHRPHCCRSAAELHAPHPHSRTSRHGVTQLYTMHSTQARHSAHGVRAEQRDAGTHTQGHGSRSHRPPSACEARGPCRAPPSLATAQPPQRKREAPRPQHDWQDRCHRRRTQRAACQCRTVQPSCRTPLQRSVMHNPAKSA